MLKDHLKETAVTAFELFKVMIPALIITKLLEEFGFIGSIAELLGPLMGLMGLPGEVGLIWATALLTSPYGAIAVYAALAPSLELTAADITVLASIVLIAHSLPIELSITRKAGARLLPMAMIRLLGAFGYGVILHHICRFFTLWQEDAAMIFRHVETDPTIAEWVMNQCANLMMICVVIFFVLLAMRLFRAIGLIRLLEKLLTPVLPMLGMSRRAAPMTVVGMILGLAYGGALIIRESSLGGMKSREVFNSLALMSLSHGLIEDTLLMMALGAKVGGILWGRLAFSLLVMYLLVRVSTYLAAKREIRKA